MLLSGKTIVVTGVGPGLGRECATVAAREGANVVMGARRSENLASVAKEIEGMGRKVAFTTVDITKKDQCAKLAKTAVDAFGRIDGLIQVAAYDTLFGGLMDADWDAWRTTYETNVFGSLNVCEAVVPHIKSAGGGSIVFVGSQSYLHPQIPQMAYASSKGALVSASFYLAKELGRDKIRVNTVVPSWMWGPPVEGYFKMMADQQGTTMETVMAPVVNQTALGQITPDDEIGEVCAVFSSDHMKFVTGQTLMVNAGELMR